MEEQRLQDEIQTETETSVLETVQLELAALRQAVGQLQGAGGLTGIEPGQSGDAIPTPEGPGYEMQLREARRRGDTLSALQIKQEAAKQGIVLL